MAGYRQGNPDRIKAAAAALLVHGLLGAAFVTGLVTAVSRPPAETLKTFDVAEPPPPLADPPAEPDEAASGEAAPPNLKTEPTPVVAPEPKLPAPSPLAAAPIAGSGGQSTAGAALVPGPGTGSGGTGSGLGGGGSGGWGAGRTGAVLVSGRLNNRDYRRIAVLDRSAGRGIYTLLVSPSGRVERCQPSQSSGHAGIDSMICAMLVERLRFRPAREADGRPIYQDVNYVSTWGPR